MKSYFFYFSVLFSGLLLSGCSRLHVKTEKGIPYTADRKLKLNVYSPKKKTKEPASVLVFIHGGSWTTGSRRQYNFVGRGMAKKGIVAVVIDYRLHPKTNYSGMAIDAAESVKWVKENIASYGGDPDKIFVSGHSAGAHLAALISTDTSYFDSLRIKNPVKGCILIDAFGLDMYSYLKKNEKYRLRVYRSVFSTNPEEWKKGSPVYHLYKGMPQFMVYLGKNTYPNITNGNNGFLTELKKYQPDASIITVPRKRHAEMIFYYANPKIKAYREITEFMDKTTN